MTESDWEKLITKIKQQALNLYCQLMFIRAHNLADITLLAELSESFLTASDPEYYRQ